MIISPAPNQQVMDVNNDGVIDPAWKAFFSAVYDGIFYTQQSGTTAKRPTKGLFAGRTYFDTTLGIPIWYKTAGWVSAAGAAV
jgi:hypothetical protein